MAVTGGHDMAKMGDKVFSGKIGPWTGEARIMDMKAHMAASGMKAQGAMPNSHHIAFTLTDAAKKPVTEGKGTVTVTGPDKKVDEGRVHGHAGALRRRTCHLVDMKAQMEKSGVQVGDRPPEFAGSAT